MTRKQIYLLLCLAGTILPYWQLVPWVVEHGLHVSLLLEQLFANRISAFFGIDVIVSAVVVFAFTAFERPRLGGMWVLPIVAVLLVGVSLGLPCCCTFGKAGRDRPLLQAVNQARHVAGAETVIDVDYGHVAGATVEHAQQGG